MAPRLEPKRRRIMRDFVIKELSSVDRPAQQGALAVLMKRDDSRQEQDMQFEKVTTRDQPASFGSLEAAMTFLQEQGMTKLAAMEAAADAQPDLIAKYNAEGERVSKAAEATRVPPEKPRAVEKFELLVEGIAKRDSVPMHVAMERARVENPGAFAAYQEA